jgi:hypothetical protein
MKILEEIGKLATECLTLDIHKRPRISDVAKRLLVLWKALQGGQDKGELLVRTQNVGTSSFNCTSSLGALLRWIIPPYTTIGKGPVWKDPMVDINCIPPWLNMWYRVICIGGIGGIGVLLVVFLHKQHI